MTQTERQTTEIATIKVTDEYQGINLFDIVPLFSMSKAFNNDTPTYSHTKNVCTNLI